MGKPWSFDRILTYYRTRARIDFDHPSGCWIWLGPTGNGGYGPHRSIYQAKHGRIANGLDIDHLCRIRRCVNPAHLEPVTRKENLRRGIGHASKTHCPKGHPYDIDNTRLARGRRHCRQCARDRMKQRCSAEYWREYRRKRKEQGHIVGRKQ